MNKQELIGHNDNFEQFMNGCILCGKDVKNEQFFVIINYENSNVWSQAEGECPTSQGGFPVGSNCATKFAAGVLVKLGGVA